MKQMIDIDAFDNDERIVINKTCEGVQLNGFTKTRLLNGLIFAREISAEEDSIAMLDGLIAKVERITEDEWERMKARIPFETYYDAESNVDEVPADEEEI